MRSFLAGTPLLLCVSTALSQSAPARDYSVRYYKGFSGDSLAMHVFIPKERGERRPAAVLLHGGGFVWGDASATDGAARDFAARGIVAFSVDYRLANRSTITPIEQTDDTFDAIRWVRRHASEYGVDASRIIAYGVSAGGYLVAMAAGSMDDSVRP